MPIKIRVIFRVIVCGLLLALLVPAAEVAAAKSSKQRVKIGVLVSLTGSWSSLGKNTVAALRIAAADLENIRPQYRPARFRFFVRDTQLDPEKALDAIRDLDQRGVRIVIGPQSSAEVAKIKPYADAHNILVISQGSTASSLAIPGDNIFRFCPNAYDALFVVQLALQHPKPLKNFDRFKAAFVDEADHYRAITGSTTLDAAGDRLNGDFDFWAVRLRNGNYTWVRVGTYNNGILTVF